MNIVDPNPNYPFSLVTRCKFVRVLPARTGYCLFVTVIAIFIITYKLYFMPIETHHINGVCPDNCFLLNENCKTFSSEISSKYGPCGCCEKVNSISDNKSLNLSFVCVDFKTVETSPNIAFETTILSISLFSMIFWFCLFGSVSKKTPRALLQNRAALNNYIKANDTGHWCCNLIIPLDEEMVLQVV